MTIISGILTDGTGQIINDCTIELYAKKTTTNVLMQTQAFTVANDGRYSMNVLPCEYDVSLIINGFPKKRLGSINVYSDSRNGTLNDFLINPTQTEVTPEFIKQVMDARDDAKKSANNAQKWASTIDTSTLVKKSGDTMTGELYINGQPVLTKRAFGLGVSHVLGDESIDETKNQYSGFLFTQQQSKGEKPFNYSHVMRSAVSDSFADIAIDILSRRAKFRGVLTDKKNAAYTGDYSWTELLTTQNISNYIPIGEFRLMPFRANELPFGWYFRNGDNYLLNSPQGQVLNRLSNNYKRDHQITIKTINGQQYINVPSAFAPDGRGFFERAVNGTTRQVGSAEDDAIREIWGHFDTGVVPNHNEYTRGAFFGTSAINPANSAFQSTTEWYTWGFDFYASRVVPTAHENRPLNIGLTPTIYLGV